MPHELDLTPEERLQRENDLARIRMQRKRRKKKAESAAPIEHTTPADPTEDALPTPTLDPNLLTITEKKLAWLASSPENNIAACAAELGVTTESIEAYILSKHKMTWAVYKHQKVSAARARANAYLTEHAALGDIKALEALAEDSKDPNRIPSEVLETARKLTVSLAKSDDELRAEISRLRESQVFTTDATRLANHLRKTTTVHVVEEPVTLLPTTDDIDLVLPSKLNEPTQVVTQPTIEQVRPAISLPDSHRDLPTAGAAPEVTVTITPVNPARTDLDIELDEPAAPPSPVIYSPKEPVSGRSGPEDLGGMRGLFDDLRR